MSDETYNGWANRSTWLVNLHLTNDQGLYTESRELVRDEYDGAEVPEHVAGIVDEATWKLGRAADALQEYVEELTTDNDGRDPSTLLRSDLVGQALADVDWREITAGLLEE